MSDIEIDGNISGNMVNIGGTQNIYNSPPPAPKSKLRVFLSYARADDDPNYDNINKSFMRRLYNELSKHFDVWWDRTSLPARALAFSSEIERAIRACDRFVLIVGPGAVASDYVRAEWEFALSICISVAPILRLGDYKTVPEELSHINAIDFRAERDETAALNDLVARLWEDAPLGQTVNVKPLPEKGYVTRKKPFEDALKALCADEIQTTVVSASPNRNAPPSATAVYGMGGIGKSTLAAALAMNCTLRRQFKDGVLWVEVGQTPTIPNLQQQIGVYFGDARENYEKETNATFALSAALQGRQALIILDDVWDHKLVERFPVTGTACRLLITTRSGKLAADVQGADIRLDVLTPQEGALLIARRTETSENNSSYAEISKKLGGHTLAVTLAAAQLATGYADDADDLLRLLDRRMQGAEPFKDLALDDKDKNQNLALSLSLSYDALTPDLQRRFRALGIFPVESTFDRDLLAAIWGDEDPIDARMPIQRLEGAGLIELAAQDELSVDSAEGATKTQTAVYQQHGLLRAYARALMQQSGDTETIFGHYADFVIEQSKQFYQLPPEQWGVLDSLLPHVQEVGDRLVRRWQAVNANSADEALLTRCGEFSYTVTKYVFHRPQMIQIDGQRELRGLRWLEMGLAVYQQLGNQRRESFLLNEIAVVWRGLGESRKALDYYEQLLPIDQALGDQYGEATTLNNIGSAWSALGEKRKALDYHEQALPLRQAVGDRSGEAVTLNNIGKVWDDLGEKRKALSFYEQALPLLRAVGNRSGEAATLSNIGKIWNDLKAYSKALEYLEQALPLWQAVGDRSGQAATLNNIAFAYFQGGDLAKATDTFRQIIELVQSVGAVAEEAAIRANLAAALNTMGNISDAIQELEQGIAILKRYNLPYDAGGVSVELYETRLAEWRGETPSQEEQAAEAMRMLAQLYTHSGAEAVREMLKQAGASDEMIEQLIAQLEDAAGE